MEDSSEPTTEEQDGEKQHRPERPGAWLTRRGALGMGALALAGLGGTGVAAADSEDGQKDESRDLWPQTNYVIPPDGADLVEVVSGAPEPATIMLNPGAEYVLSEPLPHPGNGSAIIGAGGVHDAGNIASPHITYEGPTDGGNAAIQWDSARAISGVLVKNVQIDAGGADHGFKGFYFTNRSRLSNVWVRNTSSHAFDLQRVWYGDMIRCVARQGVGGDGLRVRRICNDLYVDRFQVNSVDGRGIHGTGYIKLQLNRPVIEKTGKEGILHTDVVNGQWAIYEPYFEKIGDKPKPPAIKIDPDPGFVENSGALNLFGGYWHQNAGDPHVWTGEGVSGNLIGGEYASQGAGSEPTPKHHIRNKSKRFSILWPTLINDTEEELIKSAGPVQATGTGGAAGPSVGEIKSRNSPQDLSGMSGLYDGEQLVDDGSNTSRRGTICTWDAANGQWVPSDGSGTFT